MFSARRLTGLALGIGLAASAFAAPAASAESDRQAITLACGGYLNVYSINAPGYVNCQIDNVGTTLVRIGNCTFYYDPLFPPFGSNVVPATVNYVNCIA
jgi:hypothetical protein